MPTGRGISVRARAFAPSIVRCVRRDPRAWWRDSIRSCRCWRSHLNASALGGRAMLFLDDDDELPASPEPSEAELATRLGSDGLRAIDAALARHAESRSLKVARVVVDALRSSGFAVAD